MGPGLAKVLVLASGAAVLVIETLAARLVAPYVGLTLESHTAAIGVALLGIAAGAHLGGLLSDRVDPRSVVTGGLLVGGILVFAIRPIIHAVGDGFGTGAASAVWLIALSTLAPVTALSIIPVAVVRARLSSIAGSGQVVGSLSALGTIGALAGTFITGFVFVATLPTRAILLATGAALTATGVALAVRRGSRSHRGAVLAVAPLALLLAIVDGPCHIETAYYCARVEADPGRDGGRALWLDDLRHSYVDLDDPSYLEFPYTRRFADAIDSLFTEGEPLDVVHIGGGAFTMPRYLAATRPGTRSTVLEIDRAIVSLAHEHLGGAGIAGMDVVVGDARTSLRRLADGSADVVIGDAFGGRSVPWHLATREFIADIERVLKPGGLYVANVIDYTPNAFMRAEAATVSSVFSEVLVMAPDDEVRPYGGNFVLVASDAAISGEVLRAAAIRHGDAHSVIHGPSFARLIQGARILTDGFAPVDQLLTPYR